MSLPVLSTSPSQTAPVPHMRRRSSTAQEDPYVVCKRTLLIDPSTAPPAKRPYSRQPDAVHLSPSHQAPMEGVVSKSLAKPLPSKSVVKIPKTAEEIVESRKRFNRFKTWILKELLYPYQAESVKRVLNKRALLLADDMGLGKTRQALCAMLLAIRKKQMIPTKAKRSAEPFILIAMPGLFGTWRKEIDVLNQKLTEAGFGDLCIKHTEFLSSWQPTTVHKALEKWRLHNSFVELVFVSYGSLHKDGIDKLSKKQVGRLHWGGLIVDESHNIRNPAAERSLGVLTLRKRICPLLTILLSGTPIENNLFELTGQLRVLAPRKFNQKWISTFSRCVEQPITKFLKNLSGKDLPPDIQEILDAARSEDQPLESDEDLETDEIDEEEGEGDFWESDDREAAEAASIETVGNAFRYITRIVEDHILQRARVDACVKTHLPAIPEPLYKVLYWRMNKCQQALYSVVADAYNASTHRNFLRLVGDLQTIYDAPSLNPVIARKLAELATTGVLAHIEHPKINALLEKVNVLLDDTASSHRVLIFVHSINVAQEIKRKLDRKLRGDVQFVSGEDTGKAREHKINLASKGSEKAQRVLIITIGVGSEGLCLPQFDTIVCFNIPWSPSKWSQQIARAVRMGQKRQVTIWEFSCTNNKAEPNIDTYYREIYALKSRAVSSLFARDGGGILRLLMPLAEVSMEDLMEEGPEEPPEKREADDATVKRRKVDKPPGLEGISLPELAEMVSQTDEEEEEEAAPASPAVSFIQMITHARRLFEGRCDDTTVAEETGALSDPHPMDAEAAPASAPSSTTVLPRQTMLTTTSRPRAAPPLPKPRSVLLLEQAMRLKESGDTDSHKLRSLFECAYRGGHPIAAVEYAQMCLNGVGGDRQPDEARSAYKAAFKRGLKPSAYLRMCVAGIGGPIDLIEAEALVRKTTDETILEALSCPDKAFEMANYLEDSLPHLSRFFYGFSANHKHGVAAFKYAEMCFHGIPEGQDLVTARHFYAVAFSQRVQVEHTQYLTMCLKGLGGPASIAQIQLILIRECSRVIGNVLGEIPRLFTSPEASFTLAESLRGSKPSYAKLFYEHSASLGNALAAVRYAEMESLG